MDRGAAQPLVYLQMPLVLGEQSDCLVGLDTVEPDHVCGWKRRWLAYFYSFLRFTQSSRAGTSKGQYLLLGLGSRYRPSTKPLGHAGQYSSRAGRMRYYDGRSLLLDRLSVLGPAAVSARRRLYVGAAETATVGARPVLVRRCDNW